MIPRTVKMAQAVAAQFTSTELETYGNIIYNGTDDAVANTPGTLGWAWADSPLLPAVPLPTLSQRTPALRGWTTNYMEYFTRPGSGTFAYQQPGDPTMFEYSVHSFTPFQGPIQNLGEIGRAHV